MKKKLIFSLLVLAGVPSLSMAVDEARLLRFPATNGNEIVFSYAGDLYKVPATGGEARRLRMWGTKCFLVFHRTAKRLHSPGNTMVIQKCIPCR